MEKIINKEVLPSGVVVITMTNKDVNNNMTWSAVEDIANEIEISRNSGSNIFILASGLKDHWYEHAWLQDILAPYEGRQSTAPGVAWFKLLNHLTHPDIISIAAINGRSSGGGAEVGWACDLRFAEEKATFSQPEVDLNLTTGLGGTSRVVKLIGATHTAELIFGGKEFTANKMYNLGSINEVVKNGTSLEYSINWANELSRKPKEALSSLKTILKKSMDIPLSESLRNEQEIFQSIVSSDNAINKMREIQNRYFKGEKPIDIDY